MSGAASLSLLAYYNLSNFLKSWSLITEWFLRSKFVFLLDSSLGLTDLSSPGDRFLLSSLVGPSPKFSFIVVLAVRSFSSLACPDSSWSSL